MYYIIDFIFEFDPTTKSPTKGAIHKAVKKALKNQPLSSCSCTSNIAKSYGRPVRKATIVLEGEVSLTSDEVERFFFDCKFSGCLLVKVDEPSEELEDMRLD